MSQLLAIKERIKTITNLRQVTRAMELVTRTKIGRVRLNAAGAKNYLELFRELFAEISAGYGRSKKETPPVRFLVVFLSQKGFCGGFNDRLLTASSQYLKASGPDVSLYLSGRKNSKWNYALKRTFVHIDANEKNYAEVFAPIVKAWIDAFAAGKTIEVVFAYNAFISILEQKPKIEVVFPVEPGKAGKTKSEPLFEPGAETMAATLAEGYFKALVDKAFWESLAGEYCSRLLSMKTANDNATLIIDALNLLYNKTRQMKITQELSEIVSAFDVLKMMQDKKQRDEEE